MMNNAIANSVLCGIGNSEENTLSEYAKNAGKSIVGNIAGSKAGNALFGRNLEHVLGRATVDTAINYAVNSGLNSIEDYLRKK